jgi:murein DD-endopeptidase MepM/ murein hydrolase activator NlpD
MLETEYSIPVMKKNLQILWEDIISFKDGWFHYVERRARRVAVRFETQKNLVVDILMARRGTYQRPFLHLSVGILLLAGAFGAPVIAKAYPGGLPKQLADLTPSSALAMSLDYTDYGVETTQSQKPRDKVETYTVKEGDTLAKIADTYGVSVDTIKWVNNDKGDKLSIGETIKIPPVTGIVHTVAEGESVQSIAKKYKTDAQKIVNFPFNDFADLDTFALNVGQTLIVPDGVQPEAPPILIPRAPQFVALSGVGELVWPTSGVITQYPIWYHMAYDIANPGAPGVAAANEGTAIVPAYMRYGYGNHIIVDQGNGFSTLYGHLSEIYVRSGDHVSRGQIIGRMGSTGRSTGTHLHFETRVNGTPVNPAQYFR